MVEESDILKKLIVEEKDVVKEMEKLVDEASKYFKIEKPTGKIIFQNFGEMTDKQRVATLLLGKYFANKLKIIEDSSMSISEVAKELGKPMTGLSGVMAELVKKGYIEYLPGKKYKLAHHRIKEIFDDILSRRERK